MPSNIRELQSVLREALIASAGLVLLPQFLPPELHAAQVMESEQIPVPDVHDDDWSRLGAFVEASLASGERDFYRRVIERFDRELLIRALAQAGGHQANAATLLGLSRPTLRTKLRSLGLTMEKVVSPTPDSTNASQ